MNDRNELSCYDEPALGSISRRLSRAIFSVMPEFHQYASMIRSGEADGMSLQLVIPSPTGDEARACWIWVDEVATPTIGFGPSHTHEQADDDGIAAILGILDAILADRLLIIEDVGGAYPGHGSWIDLRDPEALEEELTSPHSPGRANLKSWSGNVDRLVGTDTLPL